MLDEHLASGALVTVPAHRGKRGHPVLLGGSLLPELERVDDATDGLREIIHRRAADVVEVPFDSDVVLLDINTPSEYDSARGRLIPLEQQPEARP